MDQDSQASWLHSLKARLGKTTSLRMLPNSQNQQQWQASVIQKLPSMLDLVCEKSRDDVEDMIEHICEEIREDIKASYMLPAAEKQRILSYNTPLSDFIDAIDEMGDAAVLVGDLTQRKEQLKQLSAALIDLKFVWQELGMLRHVANGENYADLSSFYTSMEKLSRQLAGTVSKLPDLLSDDNLMKESVFGERYRLTAADLNHIADDLQRFMDDHVASLPEMERAKVEYRYRNNGNRGLQ